MNRRTLVLYALFVLALALIINGIGGLLHRDWLWAVAFLAIGGYGAWRCWQEYRTL